MSDTFENGFEKLLKVNKEIVYGISKNNQNILSTNFVNLQLNLKNFPGLFTSSLLTLPHLKMEL